MNIIEITNRTDSLTRQLLQVWESAVRQTHTFLSESEILRIKGYVPDAISNVARLLVSMDESDKPIAFMGLEGSRIEMLFVDANHRGLGIGKQLVAFAQTYKRTDFDEEGNPYPLLYMRLNKK